MLLCSCRITKALYFIWCSTLGILQSCKVWKHFRHVFSFETYGHSLLNKSELQILCTRHILAMSSNNSRSPRPQPMKIILPDGRSTTIYPKTPYPTQKYDSFHHFLFSLTISFRDVTSHIVENYYRPREELSPIGMVSLRGNTRPGLTN